MNELHYSPFSLLARELRSYFDLCAQNEVKIPVKVLAFEDINEAYERMLKSDVHYRFADPKDFGWKNHKKANKL
jgi:D-arabinose 1-dehydrogenase-like Zn-dependent alcohol dehydrogenase